MDVSGVRSSWLTTETNWRLISSISSRSETSRKDCTAPMTVPSTTRGDITISTGKAVPSRRTYRWSGRKASLTARDERADRALLPRVGRAVQVLVVGDVVEPPPEQVGLPASEHAARGEVREEHEALPVETDDPVAGGVEDQLGDAALLLDRRHQDLDAPHGQDDHDHGGQRQEDGRVAALLPHPHGEECRHREHAERQECQAGRGDAGSVARSSARRSRRRSERRPPPPSAMSAASRTTPCQSGIGLVRVAGEAGVASDVRRDGQREREGQQRKRPRRAPVARRGARSGS